MDSETQKTISTETSVKKEKDSSFTVITGSSLAIVVLLIAELYLMTAMPHLLPAIAAVGVVMIGCAYAAVSAIVKHIQQTEREQAEQYASILKSEKAAYLLIRKYCDEIGEQLTRVENTTIESQQDVIAAQKATAKLTINRNKEHTDALLNANDRIFAQLNDLQERVRGLAADIDANMAAASADNSAELVQKQSEMMQKQTELAAQLRELELGLKNEILQAENRLSSITPQVVMAQPQQMAAPQAAETAVLPDLGELPLPDADPVTEPASELNMDAAMDLSMDLPELDLPELAPEADLSDVTEPEIPEEPVRENLLDIEPQVIEEPQMPETPELAPDIDALLNGIESVDLGELPPMEEPEAIAEPEPVAEPEPELAPMPEMEEVPPMPDLSDPNKVMSPDDIAALLANMNTDAPAPEPVAEPEPELPPMPEVEEVPPMPDLSDPNKVMSAEDIAALFANLG